MNQHHKKGRLNESDKQLVKMAEKGDLEGLEAHFETVKNTSKTGLNHALNSLCRHYKTVG